MTSRPAGGAVTAETRFAECVLPGCRNPVADVGTPCRECRTLFGSTLREIPDGQAMTAEEIAARDAGTRAAYRAMFVTSRPPDHPAPRPAPEPVRKRNQVCWLCEQRRVCTLIASRWECDSCQEVT